MPGLGHFLKKKRTREDKGDHHSGQPTSPVATSHQPQAQQQAGGGAGQTAAGGAAAPAPVQQANNNLNPHVTVNQPSQSHQDPTNAASSNANNLVNATAPQHDGAAANLNTSPFNQNQSNSSLGPAIVPTTSASPGTDPVLLQQQQQAALPPPSTNPPAATTTNNTTTMQVDSQAQQQQQHGQVQQQPQQQQQLQQQAQPQTSSGHQHNASTSSTARVTKGKYTLNDFDILRTLGTGSFGRVHLVQSKHNQRFYAIKVLKKAQVVKMKQVEHTNDERRMLSDVKHPFLITLWGTFQDWKSLYMVMDFVEGGELFSLLRKSGRFPNPVAKFYAAEVTLALEYMHSKNIIYRDLKPENLLLDRHGHLKITDFGFAKRVPDKTWTLCGTPDYLAPEVVSNKGYNKSVDWWSLGILIYEMLCGYTPFWDSGSPMRIYENILKGKVKYPAYIVPEAQDLLQKLITADLTKRLGNLYGGSTDVKNHPWFQEVTWDRLARKDIDAPYTPPVKAGAGDASQFDKYPEEAEKYGQANGNDEFGHLFTEF